MSDPEGKDSGGVEAAPEGGQSEAAGRDGWFSQRTSWDTAESEWARLVRERREANLLICDLTASNPTRCGFHYDADQILAPLADPASLSYEPDPHGLLSARKAVCGYYRDHGAVVDPNQIFLTTSTSEAYSFLFRLLCDAGDEVLIAQPGYPLFEFLADLDDVRLLSYPLFYDHGWHIDFEALRQRITPRTRAVVVVNPNNPTGHFTQGAQRQQLEALCRERGLALIVDEVFLDYAIAEVVAGQESGSGHEPESGQSGRARGLSFVDSESLGANEALTFILSGISKICALPQMKASWILCLGEGKRWAEAVGRLAVVADTFLSMNAPVQHALPSWLAGREAIQGQIRRRVAKNLAVLDGMLANATVARLEVEAGWSVVLRIPALRPDDETALVLIREHGVAVHAGELYGLGPSGWMVVSLLTPLKEFTRGVRCILNVVS